MRPDPGNVVIEMADKNDFQSKVVAHHRAFPEHSGEGQSHAGGVLELLGSLRSASASARHAGRLQKLEHAVFDVETLLKILISSAETITFGHRCTISKISDLIYFSNHLSMEDRTDNGGWKAHPEEEGEVEQQTVIIYSVGRRFGDRRSSNTGQRQRPAQVELRRHVQRTMDRRQCNRLRLIDRYSGD